MWWRFNMGGLVHMGLAPPDRAPNSRSFAKLAGKSADGDAAPDYRLIAPLMDKGLCWERRGSSGGGVPA